VRISVVVPVWNEAGLLPAVLRRVRLTQGEPVELIVVDGGSGDGTAAAAAGLADRVLSSERGRAAQMHAGALAASGELLVFLHADTLLPADWRAALEAAWAKAPRPAATAFRLGFDRDGLYYRLMARLADWRASWTGVPHGDQAIAVERAAYVAAGLALRRQALRLPAVGLLTLCLLKALFRDLSGLPVPERVLCYTVLGGVLVLSSYLYVRLSRETDEGESVHAA